jgi:hypothetical protein
MKKLIIIAFLAFGVNLNAQNKLEKTDDVGRIAICPVVGRIPDMPIAAEKMLLNKMGQITTKNGMASYGGTFIMYPHVTIMSKDITPTAPPMHAYGLDVTLYIADNITQTIFSSTTISLKGVGNNPTKAYIQALSMLNDKRPEVKTFIETAKNRIVEYYNSKCDFIIKESQTLEAKQDYQQAIYKLTSVPQVSKDCFDNCQNLVGPIYKKYIDFECRKHMTEANNVWASNQDYSGAQQASDVLNSIDPNSICYKDAVALSDKIAKRMKEIDKREWNFMLKNQQDEVDIEKASIRAARDIGVAFGENQQPTNITWINMDVY